MNDIEDQLRRARLTAPSGDLERRMSEAFRDAAKARPPVRRLLRPWFLIPGAVALGLAAILLLPRARLENPGPAQGDRRGAHHEDPSAHLVRLLLEPGPRQRPLPSLSVSVSVR